MKTLNIIFGIALLFVGVILVFSEGDMTLFETIMWKVLGFAGLYLGGVILDKSVPEV